MTPSDSEEQPRWTKEEDLEEVVDPEATDVPRTHKTVPPAGDDHVRVDETRRLLDRVQRDALVTRRDFLRTLTIVSGGLALGTGAISAGVFRRHGAGSAAPYKIASDIAPGEAVAFAYPSNNDPAIAVRLDDGTLHGYSSVCTHLGCGVIWRPSDNELFCPCHDGKFNPSTGVPVAGPPKRPLPRIDLEQRRDGIWATKSQA